MYKSWASLKPHLIAEGLDYQNLTPQLPANIIPYLIELLNPNTVVELICKIKDMTVYKGDGTSKTAGNSYIGADFIIQDSIAYLINPLDSSQKAAVYEKTGKNDVPSFKSVGIISHSHPLFANAIRPPAVEIDSHASIVFYNKLIKTAVANNATDIHIAPRNEKSIYFRLKIDGILVPNLVEDLTFDNYRAVANQIIALAGGEPGNYNNTLDGKMDFTKEDYNLSVRVSMFPTDYFFSDRLKVPRFVLRIHDNKSETKNIKFLGLNAHTSAQVSKLIALNQGFVAVTGPTSSGKTTFLYALLTAINDTREGTSIQTLEDPVEKNILGIDQCSINPAAGITYSTGLVSFLRQDLDVALIGEIRSEETAVKVTEVAMTGHLALSTVHTNTALETVNRLRRFGVDDRDISDTLRSVVATRLVRTVCPHCCEKIPIDEKKYSEYLKMIDTVNKKLTSPPVESPDKSPAFSKSITTVAKHGDGCPKCKFRKYNGRALVAEIFMIDFVAQEMISNQTSAIKIEKHLIDNGAEGIWHHAIEVLLHQETTLDELIRVLPPLSHHLKYTPEELEQRSPFQIAPQITPQVDQPTTE